MGGSCGADQSVVQGAVETRLNPSISWSFVSVGSLGRWRPILALFAFFFAFFARGVRAAVFGGASDSSAVREGCVSLAGSTDCYKASAASGAPRSVIVVYRLLRNVGGVRGYCARSSGVLVLFLG